MNTKLHKVFQSNLSFEKIPTKKKFDTEHQENSKKSKKQEDQKIKEQRKRKYDNGE